jgi:pyrimidine oxygenase
MAGEGDKDSGTDAGGTAKMINLPEGAVNFNMATLVGSYDTVARQIDLDELARCADRVRLGRAGT